MPATRSFSPTVHPNVRFLASAAAVAVALTVATNTVTGSAPVAAAEPASKAATSKPVTYELLAGMFGTSGIGDRATVEAGLNSLNSQMYKGQITNASRKAAFLATLVSESAMLYNADERGSTARYRGRGYIQLTGDFNYRDAGRYLGVDLLSAPNKAKTLQYSAAIARWYWTVARTTTNSCADAHDMNCVNRNIGFAWSYEEATRRCDRFKAAYRKLTGANPANTICYPARLPKTGDRAWYQDRAQD